MFKCPFCQSTNCTELYDPPTAQIPQMGQFTSFATSYNDDLVDMECNNCGIVTKINPRIYNSKQEVSTNEG